MQICDVLIIGGGPAGSSAAWRLRRAGVDVLVLDQESFPRLKLCAGWITPEVVRDLEIDTDAYPHRFLTFDRLQVHVKGLRLPVRCVQHSIRRFEFDAWLLQRAEVPVMQHKVRDIEREGDGFIVDREFHCRYLIGAGGTRCPVYRKFFRDVNPRARGLQAVTLEHEFPYAWQDRDCHLWFFDHGLPGYAWYVPKASGYLNVGIGGMAQRLKAHGDDIKPHWTRFVGLLDRTLAPAGDWAPEGYSYYLRGCVDQVQVGNAFLTGDAAGLATRDLCEGIGPAVRSGLRAADSILTGAPYRLEDIAASSLGGGLISRLLARGFAPRNLPYRYPLRAGMTRSPITRTENSGSL
jgi:flavin-dependent dehydrogenase